MNIHPQITYGIDWLTLTKIGSELGFGSEYEKTSPSVIIEKIRQEFGFAYDDFFVPTDIRTPQYELTFISHSGVKLYISSRGSQGVKLEIGGQSLSGGGVDEKKIWERIRAFKWRTTRIDVAIDWFDYGHTVREAWEEKMYVNAKNSRNIHTFRMNPNGDTIEVGSRKSDKFLRIYDKAKEQSVDDDWIRAEIEIKGKHARQFRPPYKLVVPTACAMMRTMAPSIPDYWSVTLAHLQGSAEVPKVDRKRTRGSKEIWLIEQVAPALASVWKENPELYERFVHRFESLLN